MKYLGAISDSKDLVNKGYVDSTVHYLGGDVNTTSISNLDDFLDDMGLGNWTDIATAPDGIQQALDALANVVGQICADGTNISY